MFLVWEVVLWPFLGPQHNRKACVCEIKIREKYIVCRMPPAKGQLSQDNVCRSHNCTVTSHIKCAVSEER